MTRLSSSNDESRALPAGAEPGIAYLRERALAHGDVSWASSFGTGSRRELRDRYARALEDATEGNEAGARFPVLRARVEEEHRAAYGTKELAAELEEERARDAAVGGGAALVAYERKWSRRLLKLQRAHPSRWRVQGLSDEELRDELTLRLIDAVSTKRELASHHRSGKEWGLVFMAQQLRELRRSFRLRVVLADLSPALDRALTGEESLIAQQSASARALATERAESALTRPQRRWLAAMKMTANAGAFFESSGKLNLAAVSRMLDKDRSSAQRAFGELRDHFIRELEKVGGC
jgi:hypothetical protein